MIGQKIEVKTLQGFNGSHRKVLSFSSSLTNKQTRTIDINVSTVTPIWNLKHTHTGKNRNLKADFQDSYQNLILLEKQLHFPTQE